MSDQIFQPKTPKPSVDRVQELASRIAQGDILLPKFQREFVWSRKQILDLLDSIYNNYPIGSILLWLSKQKLKSETKIADLDIQERPEEYPVNYLLDGQQRLSTICGVLFWDGKEKDSFWNVAFDLDAQNFFHLSELDDPPIHQIRLNKLPDASKFFRHVSSLDTLVARDVDRLKENADKLFNIFKDYSIATVTLSDMPIESVAPIFERINSTGTRLTIVDLMRAATWSEEFDLIDTIDDSVLSAIQSRGFGEIDRKAVLRNLSAAAGGGFSADSIDDLRNKTPQALKSAAEYTVKAYKLAVDFLSIEVKIPNSDIVPYVNQIVLISEIFRTNNNLNAEQRRNLKNWFWRTTLSGYFGGWNTGQMASDLAAARKFASGESPDIDIAIEPPSENIWKTRQFRLNNAHAKMLGLMLGSNNPRDLITGQSVTLAAALSWQNSKEYHHLFPQAFLKSIGEPPQRINCVANFALLSSNSNKIISDKKPSIYIEECQRSLDDEFEVVMHANLLDEACIEAMRVDDFTAFIEARARNLNAHARKICGW